MTTFINLPIEIKLEISKLSLSTFNLLIRSDKSFYVYILNHPKLLSFIKDHFTVKIENIYYGFNEIKYKLNGKVHRENDLPAYIKSDTLYEWWKDGKRHREGDLPAYIKITNDITIQEWWKDDKQHRDNDLPAVVESISNGINICQWWKNGLRYKEVQEQYGKIKYCVSINES